MAQRRQKPLTQDQKDAVVQAATHSTRMADLARAVDANLATRPTESWRTFTREHREVVLFRLSGGATVKQVCDDLGISTGVVYMARQRDREFREEYDLARRAGSSALVDRLREVHLDDTLTDMSKKIESDNLKWIAARYDRGDWGERSQVDVVSHQVFVLPTDVIDGEGL